MIPDRHQYRLEIESFDDLCLWMYCIVEDTYKQVSYLFQRPGPPSRCSDQEVMTMCLVGERTALRSIFNRRRRALMYAVNVIRKVVLGVLDVAADRQCCIDSLPVPVVQFQLAPQASREWVAMGLPLVRYRPKSRRYTGTRCNATARDIGRGDLGL